MRIDLFQYNKFHYNKLISEVPKISLYWYSTVNDLPKIINKTSAPIIFADGASIPFARPNLTGLNKNIHIVFETCNKWFKANQFMYFNKTD